MGIPVEIVGEGTDWPAWFQAVGSVAAVLAAIWTAWIAVRQTALAAAQETIRSVELVCSIGYQIDDLVNEAWASRVKSKPIHDGNFASVFRLFEAYPVDKYPSAEMALRLASIHRLAVGFQLALAEVSAADEVSNYIADLTGEPHVQPPEALRGEVERIGAEYLALVKVGQAILDRLPGRRAVLATGFHPPE